MLQNERKEGKIGFQYHYMYAFPKSHNVQMLFKDKSMSCLSWVSNVEMGSYQRVCFQYFPEERKDHVLQMQLRALDNVAETPYQKSLLFQTDRSEAELWNCEKPKFQVSAARYDVLI